MLVVVLSLAAATATGFGTLLTKAVVTRLPMWQTVGPLFLLNAVLALPLAAIADWQITRLDVLLLHVASVAALAMSTAAVFVLLGRGSASAVAVAQGASPASALVFGPVLLADSPTPLTVLGTLILIGGAVFPLRSAFVGMLGRHAVGLMLLAGAATGMITVLTGALVERDTDIGEIYFVRTAAAAVIFWTLQPPRDIRGREWPRLGVRSAMVSTGFLLTILSVQRGSVLLVQSVLATTPLLVTLMEATSARTAPARTTVVAALACSLGVFVILIGQ